MSVQRFKTAQASPVGGFETALREIDAGRKSSHWIWFIFPQLAGLGGSAMSELYGIRDEDEAGEFLRDPELRGRYLRIASALAAQLQHGRGPSLREVMGSGIDAMKVVSSLTLFGEIAARLDEREGLDECGAIARVAAEILETAEAQGHPPCGHTQRRLGGMRPDR